MGVIQGRDTIPREIQKLFKPLFDEFLPGWAGTGEYNFKPENSVILGTQY